MISLHLVYERKDDHKPLTVININDSDLIIQTAERAITEALKSAKKISAIDPVIGQIREEEARRLERVLRLLIPQLAANV
jgi:hypothetical protein